MVDLDDPVGFTAFRWLGAFSIQANQASRALLIAPTAIHTLEVLTDLSGTTIIIDPTLRRRLSTDVIDAYLTRRTICISAALRWCVYTLTTATDETRLTVGVSTTVRLRLDALAYLTHQPVRTVVVAPTDVRVGDALAISTNLIGGTVIVRATTLLRDTETKLTLPSSTTVIVGSTLRRLYRDTHPSDAAQITPTFIIGLTAIGHLTNVINALHVREWAVTRVLTEEGWDTAAGDTAKLAATVIVLTTGGRYAAPRITSLLLTTVSVIEAVWPR